MGGGKAFAAVLDDKLREPEAGARVGAAPRGRHIPTVQAFVFEFAAAAQLRASRTTQVYAFAGVVAETARTTGTSPGSPGSDAPPKRLARPLSLRAQAALDRLNGLGADVGANFTVQELRRAFRTLARRYHPDRHPNCSAIQKARLSRQFIQLHDAYRELQAAMPLAA